MTAATGLVTPHSRDRDLVIAVASGRLEALGELFERNEPDVRAYLGRLGIAPSDSDDLVQATFIEVMRAAHRFDPRYAARAWLFGIATMMVRRHRRSIGSAAARIASWARSLRHEPALTPTPEEIFEGDQMSQRLSRALERLAPKKREVFVLVTLEGLTGEEIARALAVPINTVWTRLHHARAELRAALEERDE